MLSSKSPRVRVGIEVVCHRSKKHGHGFTPMNVGLRTPFRAAGDVKVAEGLRRQRTAPQDDNVVEGRAVYRFAFAGSFSPTRLLTSNFILPAFLSASTTMSSPCRFSPSR